MTCLILCTLRHSELHVGETVATNDEQILKINSHRCFILFAFYIERYKIYKIFFKYAKMKETTTTSREYCFVGAGCLLKAKRSRVKKIIWFYCIKVLKA